ncbi:MAG: helix-turn-helix transcriptional regulator [Kiritimatiellaeota bacterium]|nr:helix-turn-helix transcriptional regulator [Kiritimatiellota bacterium]
MKHSTPSIEPTERHPKTLLTQRPLISMKDATMLANLFKVMANDTRLRLLHALARAGELCMTDLATTVAMKPQAVSNQLQKLVDRGVLEARRDGNYVFYRIVDPCVINLLESGWCLAEDVRRRVFPAAR